MAYRTIYGRKMEQFLLRRAGYEEIPGRRSASEITDAALRWIQKDPGKPFFLGLNYFDAHDPYLPPQPYRGKFSRAANPGGLINSFHLRSGENLTAEQIQSEVDAYDGAIAYVDEQIGRLIAELSRQGEAENTILIITSDHGESFGEHQLFIHGDGLFRELVHVPLIVYWKDRLPAGRRIPEPVSLAAIPSTLMDLIDKTNPAAFPWPSLRPVWEGGEKPESRPWPASQLAKDGLMYSLIRDEWQYLKGPGEQEQLYSWLKDPSQLTNLADHADQAQRIAEFREHLKELNARPVPECSVER
jgi:arylsulfatase A-like enzyme